MMTRRTPWLALILAASLPAGGFATEQPADAEEGEMPREIGLIERSGQGLVQLDVTVEGPEAAIADLSAADFELVVSGKRIDDLIVDRVCRAPEPTAAPPEAPARSAEALPPLPAPALPVSYLFYFDQFHLTMEGRVNAIENARLMIPELIRNGNRATVVSNAENLETVVEMTDDVAALIAGLDRLARDRSQWDPYAEQEESRIRDILALVEKHGERMACSAARFYQVEESYRTDKALRTFSMVLGLLASFDSPKAVVYFSDTARADSGSYYFAYGRCKPDPAEMRGPSHFGSQHAFDRVIHEASADSIRLYTVQAQGLTLGESNVIPAMGERTGARNATSGTPLMGTQRLEQAQNSLVGLALETGGRAFLNGVSAKKMVAAIEQDLTCLHLISFPRGDLPLDQPLRVLLRTTRPKVKARTRGLLVVQSEAERSKSRLLSAFAVPSSVQAEADVHGVVVPTGFEDGRYTALVQLVATGSALSPAEWDLGTSMISRGEFADHASRRVRVDRGNVPVVFETEMKFRPGPFQLTLVAHDNVTDMLGTARIEGSFPDPRDGPGMGPIAVLQPADGVFVRNGEVRRSGSLGQAERGLLRADRQTAMIGLVCRGPGEKPLRVERFLVGDGATPFPPMEISFGEERCTQVRDLIPANTMTAGQFSYEIRVPDALEEVSEALDFFVLN